jgi:hypothetical protein
MCNEVGHSAGCLCKPAKINKPKYKVGHTLKIMHEGKEYDVMIEDVIVDNKEVEIEVNGEAKKVLPNNGNS